MNSNTKQILAQEIKRLNYFHDSCIKEIVFKKNRDLDSEDGSLVYPFNDIKDMVKCDIEILMLHNNFESSKKTQEIRIEFKSVKQFNFFQRNDYDYSSIYEAKLLSNGRYTLAFFATKDKIKTLEIDCEMINITEL